MGREAAAVMRTPDPFEPTLTEFLYRRDRSSGEILSKSS